MESDSETNVSELLNVWGTGDQAALEKLMPLVYDELRRIAHRHLGRERAGHTLQTSALVNEAYLKLVKEREMHWQNRAHFFAIAARLMRLILVDYARGRNRVRRGGGALQVSLDEAMAVSDEQMADVLAMNEALDRLATFDERKSRVVELRYFSGLSVEETAEVLQISAVTVMREWRLAKAWLRKELNGEGSDES